MMPSIKSSKYTFKEKESILKYIVERKAYHVLRGKVFWKEMSNTFFKKKITERTWQALKTHFKNTLCNEVHVFTSIPKEHRDEIKAGWESSRHPANSRRKCYIYKPIKIEDDYEVSDDSDDGPVSPICRRNNIPSGPAKKLKFPTLGVFSDDEDEEFGSQQNQVDLGKGDSQRTPDLLIDHIEVGTTQLTPTLTSISEPKQLELNKSEKTDTKSHYFFDSDETTVVHVRPDTVAENSNTEDEAVEFSLEDDALLINYMKLDKAYLESRVEIRTYEFLTEMHPTDKTPKQLRARFLNHIIPNIYTYTSLLTVEEMHKFCEDAGLAVPNNIGVQNSPCSSTSSIILSRNPKNIHEMGAIQNSLDFSTNDLSPMISKITSTPKKATQISVISPIADETLINNEIFEDAVHSVVDEPTPPRQYTDAQTTVCEHVLDQNHLNCNFFDMSINQETHVFVLGVGKNQRKENILKALSARFEISPENIHFIHLNSYWILDEINRFRNAINQFINLVTEHSNLQNSENINVADIVSRLEFCTKAFLQDDHDENIPENISNTPANSIIVPEMVLEEYSTELFANISNIDSQEAANLSANNSVNYPKNTSQDLFENRPTNNSNSQESSMNLSKNLSANTSASIFGNITEIDPANISANIDISEAEKSYELVEIKEEKVSFAEESPIHVDESSTRHLIEHDYSLPNIKMEMQECESDNIQENIQEVVSEDEFRGFDLSSCPSQTSKSISNRTSGIIDNLDHDVSDLAESLQPSASVPEKRKIPVKNITFRKKNVFRNLSQNLDPVTVNTVDVITNMGQIFHPKNGDDFEICGSESSKCSSQVLHSIPSQESENMRKAVPNIIVSSDEEDIFFTAPNSSMSSG